MKQFIARTSSSGPLEQVEGLNSPVRGLAIVRTPCPCGDAVYVVAHVRSGQALFFSHSPESFGKAWPILSQVDWTRSADEIEKCAATSILCREALALVPDGFRSAPVAGEPSDVPGWEENL
jgi:hypothetical protein